MTALTNDRNTESRPGAMFNDPVAAGARIFTGSLVVLNAAGYLAPGNTAIGLKARGVAQEQANNVAGDDGDFFCDSFKGIYKFANDGTVARADIGGTAYIVDDQTVADNDGSGTRSAAGTIVDLDADGVWVEIS